MLFKEYMKRSSRLLPRSNDDHSHPFVLLGFTARLTIGMPHHGLHLLHPATKFELVLYPFLIDFNVTGAKGHGSGNAFHSFHASLQIFECRKKAKEDSKFILGRIASKPSRRKFVGVYYMRLFFSA
jgi:hypothetical protein